MLRIAAEIRMLEGDPDVYGSSGSSYTELFSNFPQVVYPATITAITGFSSLMDELTGTPVTFVGLPSENGNGAMLRFGASIGICSFSKNPEGCWEFIKYLLTDDTMQQRDGQFPVYTKALEEQINAAITEGDTSVQVNQQEVLGPRANGQARQAAISQEEAVRLRELIYGGAKITKYDSVITPIVCEEAEAYLAGEKGLTETISLIENRVRIYLGEQQ